MTEKESRWNIDRASLASADVKRFRRDYQVAKSQMQLRTNHHELYGLLAKNKSIHEYVATKGRQHNYFSEGSTQYILRKVLADTIQRVPDGELETQYDKRSVEAVELRYLFDNKVAASEFEGIDMMSNLTNTFKMSFVYAFAPVRTGFERDEQGDVRISYNLESWSDVFVNPDCKDIRRPQVVWFRQYLTRADVEALLDDDGNVIDPTYDEQTVRYVIDNQMYTAKDIHSEQMADKLKGSTSLSSLLVITEYRRGADEFVTFVPGLDAVFRKVRNYDPRKGIPWNFLVLEPDPDFPLGVSQVEFLLADQQFNDLFQTSAYKNLLLAMEPPIMVSGWETNPSSYRFEPRKIWNLGNNPNAQVTPVKIDNSVLSNWSNTRESIAASMLRNLNVMDGTIAQDSGANYSKTAPGVAQQQQNKTITINQYQKRVEEFFSQWACQALRMYVNSMTGEHLLAVDEETRRRLDDIGRGDLVEGNRVRIDFSALSAESIGFKVRTGSLVQRKEDEELEKLAQMVQPIIQNLNGWSDENRKVIEDDVLLPVTRRMVELSDTDLASTLSDSLSTQIAKNMMAGMQQQIDQQQQQIDQQGQQMAQMQAAMPQESRDQLAQEPFAGSPAPMPGGAPDAVQAQADDAGGLPPASPSPEDQQSTYEDLLSM